MKVLIVSDQIVEKKGNQYFCIPNFYDIVCQFKPLGDILLAAIQYDGKNSDNIISKEIDVIGNSSVFFVTKNRLFPDSQTWEVLKTAVKQVDLVIGYVPSINAEYAFYLARKYKKRYLSYVVGCPWDAFWNHGLLGKILAPYRTLHMKHILKKSDYALYVTSSFLQKRYPCPGLTCGCSDVYIPKLDDKIISKHIQYINNSDLSSRINIATTASIAVKYKGQRYMIKALGELAKAGDYRYNYYMIGGGNPEKLRRMAEKLGVINQVHFEGKIPHEEIFAKLDGMHMYIQPSLQEGLPRSVVEAMSRGLMGVGFNTGAMDELFDSKYVIRRRSVRDIVSILKNINSEEIINQSKRNFERAKDFEVEKLVATRASFFNEIIKIHQDEYNKANN